MGPCASVVVLAFSGIVSEFPSVRFLVVCVLGFGCAARGDGARAACARGWGRAPRVWERPGPLGIFGPLRLRCVWSVVLGGRQWPVWWICPLDRTVGSTGGYVRWVGARVEWSDVWVVLRNGEGSGLGGWEIGEGVGWEGGTEFQAKGDGHRAPRGGWPFWLEIPIYIKTERSLAAA
jgi:hypothetical protein